MKGRKGYRIRYRDKHLKLRLCFYYSLPFILVIGFFVYLMIKESVYEKFNVYYIGIFAFLVANILLLLAIFKLDIFKHYQLRINHIQKLARFLVDNGFYIKKTVNKRERIMYFPKVYYDKKGAIITVRFPLDMGKFQDRFLKMTETLEAGFLSDMFDVVYDNNFIVYKLLYEPIHSRISIEDMRVDKLKINLMKGVDWEFAKYPHALVTGGTGSGKTFTMQTLIYAFSKIGALITIADPKMADLSFLENTEIFSKSVVYEQKSIFNAISKFKREMNERMVLFRELAKGRTGLNYYDFEELTPKVLVIDEFNSYLDMFSRDFAKLDELLTNVRNILMLGRQVGCFLIVGMQRPDANYLPNGMRDNFGLRIGLGKMSDTGYSMLFGDETKNYMALDVKGFGYAFLGYGRVFQFFSPFIPKHFEFVEQFNTLLTRDKVELFSQKETE